MREEEGLGTKSEVYAPDAEEIKNPPTPTDDGTAGREEDEEDIYSVEWSTTPRLGFGGSVSPSQVEYV